MKVDADRLWRTLEEFAAIGGSAGGRVDRVALTPTDGAGRELLAGLCEEIGCTVTRDAIGNTFHRLEGSDASLAPVMIGSHLDSQPGGGRFDGALGVIGGLEVLRAIAEESPPRRSIELVNWTDEEGARFAVSCIGSSVFAGRLAIEEALGLTDADGVTVAEGLAQIGAVGDRLAAVPPHAYLELHIEQGPVLESEGKTIGVVESIVGIQWLEVRIEGASGHAGTTPAQGRRDALAAAADVIVRVGEIAASRGPAARGTVCTIEAKPNAGSVIAGEVELLVDFRHSENAELAAMVGELDRFLEQLSVRGFGCERSLAWGQEPFAMDPGCVRLVEDQAALLELGSLRMPSGAGHDAGYLSTVAPTAMVFVPCAEGISHNPRESVTALDAAAGAEVLLRSTLALCAG
jgi:N-carbamoyl-L-amino-acid hydrolase